MMVYPGEYQARFDQWFTPQIKVVKTPAVLNIFRVDSDQTGSFHQLVDIVIAVEVSQGSIPGNFQPFAGKTAKKMDFYHTVAIIPKKAALPQPAAQPSL
jgi:hypothetical protein